MKLSELRAIVKDEAMKLMESKISVKDNVPDESYVEFKSENKKDYITQKDNDKEGKRPKSSPNFDYYEMEYLIGPMSEIKGHGHYCEFDLACNIARKYRGIHITDKTLEYIGVSGTGDKFAIMFVSPLFVDNLDYSTFANKKYFNKFKECAKSYLASGEVTEMIDSY